MELRTALRAISLRRRRGPECTDGSICVEGSYVKGGESTLTPERLEDRDTSDRPSRPEPDSAQRPGRVKLKRDENIPRSAATRLTIAGYDADTVLDEKLGGRSDEDVWVAAQLEGRFLVAHDLDFSDTRKRVPLAQGHG